MLLKDFQKQFQDSLLGSSPVTDERIAIYQNSYYERIIVALKQDFPILLVHLGDAAFSSLILDYLQTHPSKHYNLRFVGKNLADFILSRDPDFAFYAQLARLEFAKINF